MLRLTPRQVFSIILTGIFLVFGYSNCSVVTTPEAGQLTALSTFSHAGITQSCASCHDSGQAFARLPALAHPDRGGKDCSQCHSTSSWLMANPHLAGMPMPISCISCHASRVPSGYQGSATIIGNLTPQGGLFDHATHGGNGDCVSCHTAVPDNVGVTWAGGVYSHSPTPSACLGCHTTGQMPIGPVGSPSYDHANVGGTDCASCHSSVTANIGRTWQTSTFSHSPVPTSCATCHLSDNNYLAIQKTIKNQMNHTFAGLQDCASCHKAAAATSGFTSWQAQTIANGDSTARTSFGVFHANFGSTPISCQACHSNERPSGWTGTVGLIGNLTPTGGLFDHSGNGGDGECANCHTSVPANIGKTWASGIYSHTPQPTSCLGCHTEAQRPIGPVGSPSFDHANGGTGDCVGCHASVPANIGKTWKAGAFAHSPAPTSCTSCHISDPLFIDVQKKIQNQMSHLISGLPDCASCHSLKAEASGWTSWVAETVANGNSAPRTSRGVFHLGFGATPTTCSLCHVNERPTVPVGAHSYSHANGGTGDCVGCHTTNVGLSWAGGNYGHSPTPTSCNSCHANDASYTGIKNTIVRQMRHSISGLPDCVGCHASAASASSWTKWETQTIANGNSSDLATKGVFHRNYASVPATCQSCHSNERPTTVVNGFNHATSGTGDCIGCHASVAKVGLSWSGGSALPASVTLDPPTGSSGWPSLTVPHPALANNPGQTCTTCHGSTPTKGGLAGYDHSAGYSLSSSVGCFYCHAEGQKVMNNDLARTKMGPLNNNTHKGRSISSSAGESTCKSCHDHSNLVLPRWDGARFSGGGGF